MSPLSHSFPAFCLISFFFLPLFGLKAGFILFLSHSLNICFSVFSTLSHLIWRLHEISLHLVVSYFAAYLNSVSFLSLLPVMIFSSTTYLFANLIPYQNPSLFSLYFLISPVSVPPSHFFPPCGLIPFTFLSHIFLSSLSLFFASLSISLSQASFVSTSLTSVSLLASPSHFFPALCLISLTFLHLFCLNLVFISFLSHSLTICFSSLSHHIWRGTFI